MSSPTSSRTYYSQVAERYDAHPYRSKDPDPYLADFLTKGSDGWVLDLACGTGNQLVANERRWPGVKMVGLDLSAAMLRQARRKAPSLALVQGDALRLPFPDAAFGYVSLQFADHHVADRDGLFGEVWRVLRPGGWLVLINVDPWGMADSWLYRYFPEAWEMDQRRFLPAGRLVRCLEALGFTTRLERQEGKPIISLAQVYAQAQDRATCSNLGLLPEEAWRAGLARIEAEMAHRGAEMPVPAPFALLHLIAVKLSTGEGDPW